MPTVPDITNPNGAAAIKRARKGNKAAVKVIKADAQSRAEDVLPVIEGLQRDGYGSLRAIAAELNARHIRTPRGGRWHASSVRNVLGRA